MTLYLSIAMKTIVQISPHPNMEPAMAYSSHIKGPKLDLN